MSATIMAYSTIVTPRVFRRMRKMAVIDGPYSDWSYLMAILPTCAEDVVKRFARLREGTCKRLVERTFDEAVQQMRVDAGAIGVSSSISREGHLQKYLSGVPARIQRDVLCHSLRKI